MFGLGWPELLALVVIGLLVFGPEKLPQAAQQAGRTLRQLRHMANNAKADLEANLGPEFKNFDPADLNPKAFVRKHLLDDVENDWNASSAAESVPAVAAAAPPGGELGFGEIPPYDTEAT
ncbi:sec-independent translocase [Microtetraspora malaysiensis]|uniref:Sec-independent translocase n=1 Tax=Microtetraspora malaysiensis TaxID=161358 RepID=A0ABW6SJY2_9ACTN|nr:sec-independent translocase [Microtetraspora malaysiensis]